MRKGVIRLSYIIEEEQLGRTDIITIILLVIQLERVLTESVNLDESFAKTPKESAYYGNPS